MTANSFLSMIATFFAVLSLYVLLAAPASAMNAAPTLQYPDASSGWGCLFFGTCLSANLAGQ